MIANQIREVFSKEAISKMPTEMLRELNGAFRAQIDGSSLPVPMPAEIRNQIADVIADIVSELAKRGIYFDK